MNSFFIVSLFIIFAFAIFSGSGRYLLVEVDAEMETMPETLIEGKGIGSQSLTLYFNFRRIITYHRYL